MRGRQRQGGPKTKQMSGETKTPKQDERSDNQSFGEREWEASRTFGNGLSLPTSPRPWGDFHSLNPSGGKPLPQDSWALCFVVLSSKHQIFSTPVTLTSPWMPDTETLRFQTHQGLRPGPDDKSLPFTCHFTKSLRDDL